MWTIFKSLCNLLQYGFHFMFCVLVFWPEGMWDPSSPARDWTHTPCIGKWSLNHWTAREVCHYLSIRSKWNWDESVVQLLSRILLFSTPWTAAHQPPLSSSVSWCLLKFMSIESGMLSNHLVLCHHLLLLPSIFPSIRVFSSESALHFSWPKYWNFSFSISPSNEYSGLITFRIEWFDLLAVQVTLKSLLQHHNLKASILQCSAFFTVQLISVYDYWKNHRFDYTILTSHANC